MGLSEHGVNFYLVFPIPHLGMLSSHTHSAPGLGRVNLHEGLQGLARDPDLANHSDPPLHHP